MPGDTILPNQPDSVASGKNNGEAKNQWGGTVKRVETKREKPDQTDFEQD